jgi:hypothetical protein
MACDPAAANARPSAADVPMTIWMMALGVACVAALLQSFIIPYT